MFNIKYLISILSSLYIYFFFCISSQIQRERKESDRLDQWTSSTNTCVKFIVSPSNIVHTFVQWMRATISRCKLFFFLTKIHASDTPSEDEISINGNLHKKSFA